MHRAEAWDWHGTPAQLAAMCNCGTQHATANRRHSAARPYQCHVLPVRPPVRPPPAAAICRSHSALCGGLCWCWVQRLWQRSALGDLSPQPGLQLLLVGASLGVHHLHRDSTSVWPTASASAPAVQHCHQHGMGWWSMDMDVVTQCVVFVAWARCGTHHSTGIERAATVVRRIHHAQHYCTMLCKIPSWGYGTMTSSEVPRPMPSPVLNLSAGPLPPTPTRLRAPQRRYTTALHTHMPCAHANDACAP